MNRKTICILSSVFLFFVAGVALTTYAVLGQREVIPKYGDLNKVATTNHKQLTGNSGTSENCSAQFPPLRFGNKKRYQFSQRFLTSSVNPDARESKPTYVSGFLNLFYQGEVEGASLYAMQLEALVSNTRKSYEDKVYLISVNKDGRFDKIFVPDDHELFAKGKITPTEVAYNLQFVIQNSLTSTWSSTEQDYIGQYQSDYMFDKKTCNLQKSKSEYLSMRPAVVLPIDQVEPTAPDVESSHYQVTSEPMEGIQSVVGDDTIIFRLGDTAVSKQQNHIEFEVVAIPSDTDLAIWKTTINTLDDLDDYFRVDASSYYQKVDEIRLAQYIADLEKRYANSHPADTIDMLVDDFHAGKAEGQLHAKFQRLKEMLWVRPELSIAVADYLSINTVPPKAAVKLVYLLEEVGHEAAQLVLTEILDGSIYPRLSRLQSAVSLGRIDKPTVASVMKLKDSYSRFESHQNSTDSNDPITAIEADVAYTALLALGTAAATLRNGGDAVSAADAVNHIIAAVENSTNTSDLHLALRALDNSRYQGSAQLASAYLDHADSYVRSAAVYMQRLPGSSSSLIKLTDMLKTERDTKVQRWITRTLEEWPDSREVTNALNLIDLAKTGSD